MNKTKIEWCDITINPITGCTPISAGCKNCYAESIARRFLGERKFSDIRFFPERLKKLPKKPSKIFLNSMGDLFHESVKKEWIDYILDIISAYPQHTFIILTKRPENTEDKIYGYSEDTPCRTLGGGDYLPNLWLGVTCENQEQADKRIPILLQIPAAVRFVSIEPMLAPIDLNSCIKYRSKYCVPSGQDFCNGCFHSRPLKSGKLDWVICGAETGRGKRPMDLDWARLLRDQCVNAGVPFFFKKDSDGNHELDGQVWEQNSPWRGSK